MIILILLLSFFDMLLTHYQFFMDRKKKVMNMRSERNIIPRLIMGKNPNPKNFIVGCVFTITVLSFLSFFIVPVMNCVFNANAMINVNCK